MEKPAPIFVLSILAMLNGGVTFGLGVMTLLGSEILFKPSGYGPNRIAVSQLFGPFANQTGWIFLALGALFLLVGYGLLNLKAWARLTVFWVFAIVAGATLLAVGWGIYHRELGMVVSGLLKITVEVALCLYLITPRVRSAFSH